MGRQGVYERGLVDYDNGVIDANVNVEMAICNVCGHSHAELPDVLVPHKSYCILFILKVLKEYFHTRAVTKICDKYKIAVSTLYAWRDRYLTHAELDLGRLVEGAILGDRRWFTDIDDTCYKENILDFFERFGFSFMQYSKTTEFGSS